jgi:DNA-binding CsgD family transcriptional regulator
MNKRFHGHSVNDGMSPTYTTWAMMIQRCHNPKATGYHAYGGRGIKVCMSWRRSFRKFLAYMGERPEGMTLDRIDNNGDYEPGNCRWSTSKVQRANSSRTIMTPETVRQARALFASGATLSEVAAAFGINRTTAGFIRTRRSWGWVEDTTPMMILRKWRCLTADQIEEIKRLLAAGDLSQRQIADNFSVSQQTISGIKLGKRYGVASHA